MKKKPLSIIVAVVLLSLWFFARPSIREKQTLKELPSSPTPTLAPRPIARVTEKKLKPQTLPISSPVYRPEGNRIKFNVVDGLAVAYGDILLGEPEQTDVTEGYYDAPTPRLWEKNEIPYLIHSDLPEPARVQEAIAVFEKYTPLHFVPYEDQPDAIVFEPGKEHCYSLLGRAGGRQPIKLSPKCYAPEIIHEIMHALGFVHEQSRTDRDEFVEVLWSNIEEKYRDQFAVVPDSFMISVRDRPFDYHSIMMYGPTMFATQQGLTTLRSKSRTPISPATRGLSAEDIERLNIMYRK